jgi:hypothetical protein
LEEVLRPKIWGQGIFCATSGWVTDEEIQEYSECHDEEPPEPEFRIDF